MKRDRKLSWKIKREEKLKEEEKKIKLEDKKKEERKGEKKLKE